MSAALEEAGGAIGGRGDDADVGLGRIARAMQLRVGIGRVVAH